MSLYELSAHGNRVALCFIPNANLQFHGVYADHVKLFTSTTAYKIIALKCNAYSLNCKFFIKFIKVFHIVLS